MVALKPFRPSGPSFSDLVPYAGLVDNGVMLLKDGSLMAGWYFAGPDSESSTEAERNEVSRQINAILARLGSGWMIQVEAVRVPTTDYPAEEDCHFPDAVTRAIDAERRAHFEREKGHFESRHALILTWRPPEPRRSGLTRYVYSDAASRSTTYADGALDAFSSSIREVEQYLANVISIRRMLTQEVEERGGLRTARYDDLFQFIRFCVTGENHPVRLPDIPMYLDWLVTAELQHGLTPTVENRFLGVVAIDGLPAESWPGILNALDLMPLTYRWSSRFVFLDEQEARARLERTRQKWQQKVRPFFDQLFQTQSRSLDQDAMLMVAETEDAIAEAASQLTAYGYYTPVIVLFDDEQTRLQEKCEAVRRLIQAEGFGARIETLNATDAFLGSLPWCRAYLAEFRATALIKRIAMRFASNTGPTGLFTGCSKGGLPMRKHIFTAPDRRTAVAALAIAAVASVSIPVPVRAGGVTGEATEFTQLANNAELISLVGKSAEQVNNQITQINQLAEQIQNQLRIYENMLQNTAQLPAHVWGQVESDLNRLQSIVGQGQGIAFSMGNIDDTLKQRFQSYAEMKSSLPDQANFSTTYQSWSDTNRDTIAGTLKAANLTAEQFSSEESTMSSLRTMSESADGQMKALQVGHEIATQQVAQMQKLRGLVSQQMTMMGTWYQSEQAQKDLAQARREQFFNAPEIDMRGGQTMEPRW
ncbi:P-type conjugative transfer protein TrbJ [Aminobacter sp. SR38]|uniref:P-type conjugative transfer protein TrbJ n=1 Tax=Aminobacter sp. SR38 TaxID=2774562 RepID=UPI001FF07479|nr:P-type conjugative transfer protein TrbJ [Aminobacter sp. SR38]